MNETKIYKTSKVVQTKEELLDMYIKYSLKLGKGEYGASELDLINSDFPYGPGVLSLRFGNINNLRKQAGFKLRKPGIYKYTKTELKNILYKKYKEKGRRLTQKEVKKEDMPTTNTFLRHFQTTKMTEVWDEVLKNKKS
ncbi:MAG: hypothetical protein LBV03_01515 [Fusobacteriales bacterium]|jgi:hypothetical protein|nr:hypothetical protein [Fusobacteriales bacterium]